jgi:hypothetical protein
MAFAGVPPSQQNKNATGLVAMHARRVGGLIWSDEDAAEAQFETGN